MSATSDVPAFFPAVLIAIPNKNAFPKCPSPVGPGPDTLSHWVTRSLHDQQSLELVEFSALGLFISHVHTFTVNSSESTHPSTPQSSFLSARLSSLQGQDWLCGCWMCGHPPLDTSVYLCDVQPESIPMLPTSSTPQLGETVHFSLSQVPFYNIAKCLPVVFVVQRSSG